MPIEITMPRLSDTMESGTILKWNVKEGDEVSSGDSIADVETDKATMEMQVYDDGTVAKILVEEGKTVDVGTVIAVLAEEGEDASEAASSAGKGKSGGKKKKKDGDEEESADEEKEAATATKDEDEDEEGAEGEDAGKEDREEDREGKKPRKAAERDASDEEEEEDEGEAEAGTGELPARARSEQQPQSTGNGRVRISPVARRLADEHHIDPGSLKGSGPGGRVIKRDVLHAIETGKGEAAAAPSAARTAPSPGAPPIPADRERKIEPLKARTVELSGRRQTIAKRLIEAKTTIPHYQVTFTFIMDPLLALRTTLNEQLSAQGVKLSVNDFLVRACALANRQHHEFNASWDEKSIKIHGEVNIGIAISIPASRGGGLVVANVRNADQKGLRQISQESKDLAEKARTKGLSQEEMSETTFTISNLGMYGVEHFTAIINPPNSAILAVGAAIERPLARDGQIVIGHEMQATLSCDHRIIDGAMAAEYLQTLKSFIENPATLLV